MRIIVYIRVGTGITCMYECLYNLVFNRFVYRMNQLPWLSTILYDMFRSISYIEKETSTNSHQPTYS